MKIYIHTLIEILRAIIIYMIIFFVVQAGLKLVHQESMFAILSGVVVTALGFVGLVYYTSDLVGEIVNNQKNKK
jgi:hypothetical protein